MSELRHITLGDMLAESARHYATLPAVEYDGQRIPYAALDRWSDDIAKALLAAGVKRGAHVAIWETDRPATLACFFGAVKIGAVAVLPNTSLTGAEMCALLRESDVTFLFYGDGYRDISFPEVVAELPAPQAARRVHIGKRSMAGAEPLEAFLARGSAVSDAALAAAKEQVRPEDPAAMLFTSGTVGASRGVLTSHYARVNSAIQQAEDLFTTPEDRFLVAIPMFHCFSLSANVLGALSAGACVVFPENRRTLTLLTAIDAGRCTVFHAVPTLFHALLARPDFDTFELSSLRIGLIGGACSEPEQMRAFRERMGYELLPSLGLTEATGGITVARPSDPLPVKLETVGHFMDHIEGRICDPESGRPLPSGQTGEICVRGYCVMQGYYGLPEQTRAAIDGEGFLHTGDLGFLDGDGNVHYRGRRKEVIIRGGENIFPGEIEACIRRDARVRDVRVVGVPDAHYGEEVCACVVAAPGGGLDAEAVRSIVRAALAYYKVPRHVLFFDALPAGGSGKVRLGVLREQALQRLGVDGGKEKKG